MANYAYMAGKRKYGRPQAMLFSDGPGKIVSSVVNGETVYGYAPGDEDNFLILSDHNRGKIDIKSNRLETRQRMVNGRMRSYHIADKETISTSWDNLPSRSYASMNLTTNEGIGTEYTVDGGAGGSEILDWYDNHPGSFWVYLSYDNPNNFKNIDPTGEGLWNPYEHLNMYSEVIEVFFSDFNHSIDRRGGGYDFWNVSLSLEEV